MNNRQHVRKNADNGGTCPNSKRCGTSAGLGLALGARLAARRGWALARPAFCGIGGLLLLLGLVLPVRAASRPNVLFIYTDDQAPTAIGMVNSQLKTPNIDRIFREGAWLKNAFVTTPVCSPARATIMTSRYGSELGIFDWINARVEPTLGLDPDIVIWPELFQRAGYATALVGKWHLGEGDRYHPTRNGFDYFMGFRGGGTSPKNPRLEEDGVVKKREGFTSNILTDHAIQFIRKNSSRPFLLCMHYRAPHAAWLPVPDEDWAPYKNLEPAIPNPDYPKLNVPKIKRMTREYYASVAGVDRNVGRLLDLLDELKLSDNTVVVFTSDHGYNLGHHGVWFKGNAVWQLTELPPKRWPHIARQRRPNLFDQSLRVPAAIRWPRLITPGSVVTETISTLNWYPTLLAIAEIERPANVKVRGRSFLPLLQGKRIPWDNDLYAEYSMRHGSETDMRAWRTPKWKLMIDFLNKGRAELYNLEKDSGETTNLIDSEQPDAQRMRQILTQRIKKRMQEIGDQARGVGGSVSE